MSIEKNQIIDFFIRASLNKGTFSNQSIVLLKIVEKCP